MDFVKKHSKVFYALAATTVAAIFALYNCDYQVYMRKGLKENRLLHREFIFQLMNHWSNNSIPK